MLYFIVNVIVNCVLYLAHCFSFAVSRVLFMAYCMLRISSRRNGRFVGFHSAAKFRINLFVT